MESNELNKEVILELLNTNHHIIKRFGVKRIGLFGSYSRGQPCSTSDIDFLVEFEPGKKTYKNFIGLANFLENLFESKVDLITKNSLSPYLKPYILKEVKYAGLNH